MTMYVVAFFLFACREMPHSIPFGSWRCRLTWPNRAAEKGDTAMRWLAHAALAGRARGGVAVEVEVPGIGNSTRQGFQEYMSQQGLVTLG
jgi:hypothetical protein